MSLCELTDLRVGRWRPGDKQRDTISEVGFPQLETSKSRQKQNEAKIYHATLILVNSKAFVALAVSLMRLSSHVM